MIVVLLTPESNFTEQDVRAAVGEGSENLEFHEVSTIPTRRELKVLNPLPSLVTEPTPTLDEIAAQPDVPHQGEPQPAPHVTSEPVRVVVIGEDAAVALGATTVPVQAQSNALMEVAAGTSDAAVIDVLMAAEMTGEGTSYADLVYSLNLNEAQDLPSEEYGVGFRQGSDLVDAFNTFLAEKVADGTVLKVATTYGLQDAVILE